MLNESSILVTIVLIAFLVLTADINDALKVAMKINNVPSWMTYVAKARGNVNASQDFLAQYIQTHAGMDAWIKSQKNHKAGVPQKGIAITYTHARRFVFFLIFF